MAEEAARVGVKINARKCQTLRTEYGSNRESIVVNGQMHGNKESQTREKSC